MTAGQNRYSAECWAECGSVILSVLYAVLFLGILSAFVAHQTTEALHRRADAEQWRKVELASRASVADALTRYDHLHPILVHQRFEIIRGAETYSPTILTASGSGHGTIAFRPRWTARLSKDSPESSPAFCQSWQTGTGAGVYQGETTCTALHDVNRSILIHGNLDVKRLAFVNTLPGSSDQAPLRLTVLGTMTVEGDLSFSSLGARRVEIVAIGNIELHGILWDGRPITTTPTSVTESTSSIGLSPPNPTPGELLIHSGAGALTLSEDLKPAQLCPAAARDGLAVLLEAAFVQMRSSRGPRSIGCPLEHFPAGWQRYVIISENSPKWGEAESNLPE